MTERTRVLAEAVARLPAAERIVLVEEILATLTSVDADWETAWCKESARRMAAFEQGDAGATDADEVFDELDARYR